MVSYTFRNFISLIVFTFTLSFNAPNASADHFIDAGSDAGSDHTQSHARLAPQPQSLRDDDDAEGTPTESDEELSPNGTCANSAGSENSPSKAQQNKQTPAKEPVLAEEDGFISVAKQARVAAKFQINGGVFSTLSLPDSSMPYTEIILSYCTCFMPLDPSQFQNNPELRVLSLAESQLNLRCFEEKLGENCTNLSHIDLQGFTDVSVEGQSMITPERFAQLAHPGILERILSGQCNLFISHPERDDKCYDVEEMKGKFLSSILQRVSLRKAKETDSTYQTVLGMLTAGISHIDLLELVKTWGLAFLSSCTGGIIKGS